MESVGLSQTTDLSYTVSIINEMKKLMELQGELVVKLIESASVQYPADNLKLPGLGSRIDILV